MVEVPWRVYVADDHPVYRSGLVRAINARADLSVVGEARDGRQALAEISGLAPDVAVLEARLPSLGGPKVLGALQRDHAGTRVLVLSAFVRSDVVYSTIAQGARAYLSKASSGDEICDAIAAVAGGEVRLAPEIQMQLAAEIQARNAAAGPTLTSREREILRLTSEGLSAEKIGRRLHFSPATIKSHLRVTYEKLGVTDRAAAVATSMRLGLLE